MTPPDEEGWERLHHDFRPPRVLRALGCVVIGILAYPFAVIAWMGPLGVACKISNLTCDVAYWGWLVAPVAISAALATWIDRRTA